MDSSGNISPESVGSPLASFYYPHLSPYSTTSDISSTSIFSAPSPNGLHLTPEEEQILLQSTQDHNLNFHHLDQDQHHHHNHNHNHLPPAPVSLPSSIIPQSDFNYPSQDQSNTQINQSQLNHDFIPLPQPPTTTSTTTLKSRVKKDSKRKPKIVPKIEPGTTTSLSSNKRKKSIISNSNDKSSRSRSRFGCEECKSKRIKCDEIKPRCSRCKSRGIKCNYKIILKFREDLEHQGKKFGREGVWFKQKENANNAQSSTDLILKSKDSYYKNIKNINQLKFINFFYQDLIRNKNYYANYKLSCSLQSSIIPVDILNSNLISDDPSSLNFALTYYINFISPILNPVGNQTKYFNLTSNKSNKYIVVQKGLDLSSLVQYSQNNNNLFYLILSLGSIYLSKLNGGANNEQDWVAKSKLFQNLGIERIKQDLDNLFLNEDSPIIPEKIFKTDVLISLTLLILYELANDCNPQWTIYLKMCKKILHSSKFNLPHDSMEYSLLKFALEFLDYQESIGRTACKDENSFFLVFEEEAEKDQSQSPTPPTELIPKSQYTPTPVEQVTLVSWMGCDKRLMQVISDITDLSFERYNAGITEANYLTLCQDMRQRLDKMSLNMMDSLLFDKSTYSSTSTFNSTEPSTPREAEMCLIESEMEVEEFCFLLSCEIKRLATIVYLESCLLNKTPEDELVQRLVRQIFTLLEFIVIKNDFKWYSTLIWSVFIAASEISSLCEESEELRYITLQILDLLESNTLGNIGRTRKIIMDIWKRRDLDNSDENSFGYVRKTIEEGGDGKNAIAKRGLYLGFQNDWEKYVVDEDYAISLA
ncbi:fungal-specific transcription factor domain-containing protein [Scheffersomyces coipomensis]|uniref:fungal-specific transcription factor domain-containing protein n=1 Tax=Scheffersomyces coipomensis TaxID=1788519 RepID=UPI00315C9504